MNEIASNTFLYVILSFAEELCSLFWTAAILGRRTSWSLDMKPKYDVYICSSPVQEATASVCHTNRFIVSLIPDVDSDWNVFFLAPPVILDFLS